MATIVTKNQCVQHFQSLTGANTIEFNRPINSLFMTTTGAVQVSFDDGYLFMDLQANALNTFYHLHQARIKIQGAGSVNGMGLAI